MTERQFHNLMSAIYDLAGQADQDPEIAWKLPQLIVKAAREATDGTPAAAWVERWKKGDDPVGPDAEPAVTRESLEATRRVLFSDKYL